ncbi:MAG: hypothetical protein WD176_07310 [Pirellulales bacterium]
MTLLRNCILGLVLATGALWTTSASADQIVPSLKPSHDAQTVQYARYRWRGYYAPYYRPYGYRYPYYSYRPNWGGYYYGPPMYYYYW